VGAVHGDFVGPAGGRPGDIAVVAELDREIVGVANCRLFTEADHGHGYVDDETPEVAVAVREGRRGRGLGARLMNELAKAALAAGFSCLSLSIDADNPARRLYERLGYCEPSSERTACGWFSGSRSK
jgi:GNAT superfamily N-acetyltransferase